ncbi:MAG: TonB-dependent receptor [Erythrobacter sp.]|uniref:TonB-dependent receptor n=1 Tax=Erythrobacter sp. HL-111 TaxID=1798193 RepID=UPI0006D98089|nr:TonB-dependent receptor [Erythrobacter sp. HL-111]KPP94894.1 MAG: TonB-dependent receptor [Erythrobacteraceae bacterium HL-111]SDS90100.1 Outer membrane receptor proteins, mostly Fe transport [Erythrobacter sp. HL-111]
MGKLACSALLAATMLTPSALLAQEADEEEVSIAERDAPIIVTARKREETLQSVPSTVAVVTSETITELALDNLEEIANTTPGLFYDESLGRGGGAAFRPVIRGQANILGESGVAFFIDGIYYTGSLADYDVDTIERIEVVKGPQSALYGRNTYSGAINIISKKPGDTWEGRLALDASTQDRYEITAGIRGPITDGLSLGLNGRYYDFGGEFTNQFDGTKIGKQSSWSASGVLDWDDGGPFTATFRAYYNRTDDGQPALFQQDANQNNCFFDNGSLYGGRGRYFCGRIDAQPISTDYTRQFINPADVGIEADTYNVSLRMAYEFSDRLSLVSLTGFNDRTESQLTDGDYSPESFQTAVFARFPIGAPVGFGPAGPVFPFGFVGSTVDFSFAGRSELTDWSQELRLNYDGDGFDLVLGGYFFDQSDDNFSIREVPADALARAGASFGARFAEEQAGCAANPACASIVPLFGPSLPEMRDETRRNIENIAVFGAVNVELTPTLNLSLEGRYAEETIEQVLFDFDEGQQRPAGEVFEPQKFTSFTPRVTLDWQATPDNLIYAVYAEGIKPGGFNNVLARNAGLAAFEEEENKAYEIGFKNAFFDGAMIFNLAAFFTDIEGYQLSQNVEGGGQTFSATVNAGAAEIWGIEAEMVGRLGDFTLTANYALADTEFVEGFDEQQGILNDVADDGLVNCSTGDQFPDIPDCQSLFGSIAGKDIPRAPEHRVFADLAYQTPLGGGMEEWSFFAGANMTYTSSSFAQVHNEAFSGDATEVDARIGVENDRLRIQFYAENLFEEDAVRQILRFADGNNDFRRSFVAAPRPGRRVGLLVVSTF